MPNYKKVKKRNRKLFKEKRQINLKSEYRNGSNADDNSATNFRIISGKKEVLRKRNLIIFAVFCVCLACVLIFSLLSPTGVIETSANYLSGITLRTYYPSVFEGNELFSVNTKGNHIYTLSNQTLTSYNIGGKQLFEHFHGAENPVVSLSETRVLLYDQNGTSVNVFTANKELLSFNTEFSVYVADITRNGYFAVATKSQSYTSTVTVYDDDGNFVYEWNSPEEIVTGVALSSNGKQLAVSAVKSQNGIFVSNVYIFNYNSAEPIWRQSYNDTFIFDLISDNSNYFCVVSQNRCDFVKWKDHTITSHVTDSNIQMIRTYGSKTVVCEPHSSDTYQNKFTVYNRKCENIFQYDFSGYVDDFAYKNNSLYILSGNTVFHVNKEGETLSSAECSFGTLKAIPFSSEKIITVSDNTLNQIHFNNR